MASVTEEKSEVVAKAQPESHAQGSGLPRPPSESHAQGNVLPMPTTDETLTYNLKRSLIAQGAAKDAGRTWGEFKKAGDALMGDDQPLAFIEYGVKQGGLGHLMRDDDEDPMGVGIREI